MLITFLKWIFSQLPVPLRSSRHLCWYKVLFNLKIFRCLCYLRHFFRQYVTYCMSIPLKVLRFLRTRRKKHGETARLDLIAGLLSSSLGIDFFLLLFLASNCLMSLSPWVDLLIFIFSSLLTFSPIFSLITESRISLEARLCNRKICLTLRFNSWPKSDHFSSTFLRKISQTSRSGGPPSFLKKIQKKNFIYFFYWKK